MPGLAHPCMETGDPTLPDCAAGTLSTLASFPWPHVLESLEIVLGTEPNWRWLLPFFCAKFIWAAWS